MRLLLVILLLPLSLFGQRFGGTPPSVKWRQINTDSARIIFPAGLDSQAQRVATLVHYQASHFPVPLGHELHKINIVLQNQTTVANGYVTLGPYRSEFFLNPSLNNFTEGSIPWADQLSLHEYRHVQQYNNFRNGISNIMRILFGEEGYALAVNASIPDWFYEGDAVYNETILTQQGRGRMPLFMNSYPSLWQAGKNYSWMKLRNGSLKDYVPTHYSLGYLLVNYGREKYGLDFWEKVTKDASAFKGLFYPFQKSIKKYAGVDYSTFRKEAEQFYKTNLPAATKQSATQDLFPVNKKVLTNYFFPYNLPQGELLYLQIANNRRPAFFIRDSSGGKHFLRTRDISIDEQYSYRNGKLVYAAYENDPRWTWRDYSVIRMLDVSTGKQKTITRRSKYFTPDISESGNKIATAQVNSDGRSELHILDTKTGDLLTRIRSVDVTLFTDPKFISEDSVLCAVRLLDGRMALAIANLNNGSLVRFTPPSFNVVGFPFVDKNAVYFTASYGGNDDIFAVKRGDSTIYRLTNGPLGNYFANAGNGQLTWSTFTADGYQLQQQDEKNVAWSRLPAETISNSVLSRSVSHTNDVSPVDLDNLPVRKFATKKYSKATRPFNFHSWRPYYEDPEFTFSIYGENVLNTLQTQLYYLYNENEHTNAVGATAVYGGFFPYITVGTQYTFDRSQVYNAGKPNQFTAYWDQLDTRVGLSIPLNWTKGKTFRAFNAGTNYVHRSEYGDSVPHAAFTYLHHFISYSQQVEMAVQHIFPRLGYSISLENRHAITSYKSWQTLGRAAIYLPGFFPNHSIVLTGAYQETDTVNVLFSNRMAYSRGYNSAYFARMWRTSVNYHFPIVYPDWGFANIFYLQRIRANGFFDLTKVYSRDKSANANQRSTGGEIYFDTKWWNQYPLSFGFRVSYLLDRDFITGQKQIAVYEFILPVSIIPK